MNQTYRVGMYCRLSVDDASNPTKSGNYIPAEDSVSIENQKELLSRFVMLNGWVETRTYIDDGYSGGNFQRPGFVEMLEDARNGVINLILVKDLSRLGRDYVEVGRYADIVFPSLGCRFVSVLDCLDSEGDNTDMLHFRSLMNDYHLRDLSSKISSAGIPIYVTTGRNGGIQFLDDYVLNKSFFSDSEKLEILSSLQSLSAVQYPEVDTVLNKLGAIFQIGLTDWIDVDFSRWGSVAENENRLFRQLKQAILENREITFDYHNSTGNNNRRNVYPYKLVYKDRAWYLYAFCLSRSENRLFRLSRIKNLILTEVHFERKTETYQYHSLFPKPEEIGNLIDLELEFALDVGYRLFDTLDDTAITQHENGYTVKLTLPENDWLYDFLMSFGNKVTIIQPKSIRQTLKAKHEAAREHHKGE